MSRAKKTKKAKKYSAIHLYRQITEVLNHSDNQIGKKHSRGGYGTKNKPKNEDKS